LAIHIPFSPGIMVKALDTWSEGHAKLVGEGVNQPRVYNESVYQNLARA
jgi:hypothetical protein